MNRISQHTCGGDCRACSDHLQDEVRYPSQSSTNHTTLAGISSQMLPCLFSRCLYGNDTVTDRDKSFIQSVEGIKRYYSKTHPLHVICG